MSFTIGNFTIGHKRTGGFEQDFGRHDERRYWDEGDRLARYNAISDACWIYQYRDLEQNLRHFGWRQARKKVLAQGAFSGGWANRGRGDLRLTRGGLQMRFRSGVRTLDLRELKEFIDARRS
jgi:hypothetical protein